MNRIYLIIPVVFLLLFGGIYWKHNETAALEAARESAELARADEAARLQKTEAERKAREDAGRRAAEREAAERRKEEERRAKWEAESILIAEETARHTRRAAEASAELAALEKQLAALRAWKEEGGRAAFEAERENELLTIKKRNAELEIQRITQIVARRAAASPGVVAGLAP